MAKHSMSRTELLIGEESLNKLKNKKVVILGIGGVGSFAVEALVRGGVGKLVLVDDDIICITNLNRQIHATYKTVGRVKVDVMKERILEINPDCEVTALRTYIDSNNMDKIITKDVDYVIDAIDSITSKIQVAIWCENNDKRLISSMGTGNKLDPTEFKVADIYDTKICPLCRVMRKELRRKGVKHLKVVYSVEEVLKPAVDESIIDKKESVSERDSSKMWAGKRQVPGSISFVPPVAGMIIAGEVIKDMIK
ncbi:tRNA threonylcarbamoyladenosine dehydratase [Clostridium algidicarnis]|uniref:tRNA threonylcarbamoyladenosine dehydratase n=1 Tax=Clostridium algidicarnis TaxID=37659 RepID=UPI001C0AA0D7|nr:tRNA threonylcarbamoyladenosine dehydratase [Clostridium algidicarnis]MBU3229121.1 tRNA threonylcarbamoyladenosine dehydratase [Clostridium algidicarnis]MBU3252646.1 tRNA threonylcarbamoyladenosine dehydratase [Clostridium algidicarnis]